ncbi:MAG: ribonuclease P protein component [Thermoguttaceae bacterium]
MSLPRTQRLRKTRQFQDVRGARCRATDDVLVVFGRTNSLGVYRLGLAVSRKIGNAVVRNRWKRVIREAVRSLGKPASRGIDLVVSPSINSRDTRPTLHVVTASLRKTIQRIERRF